MHFILWIKGIFCYLYKVYDVHFSKHMRMCILILSKIHNFFGVCMNGDGTCHCAWCTILRAATLVRTFARIMFFFHQVISVIFISLWSILLWILIFQQTSIFQLLIVIVSSKIFSFTWVLFGLKLDIQTKLYEPIQWCQLNFWLIDMCFSQPSRFRATLIQVNNTQHTGEGKSYYTMHR